MKHFTIVLLLLTPLAGCVQPQGQPAVPVIGDSNANLVYFPHAPQSRLYVEVDAVEGAEFSNTELQKLEQSLREWTQKPEGVSVVKSSVIPRSVARGKSANALARLYLDGPAVATNEVRPAFIYILVYDNRLNRNPAQSPRAASHCPAKDQVPAQLAAPANPHVDRFPYPAMIYLDRSWLGGLLPKYYWDRTLLHEAGHVLGLVSRESQIENHHCATNWCLMGAHVSDNIKRDILAWLKNEKPKALLCEACEEELRQYQTSTNTPATRFIGPVLVRTMPSYSVLSLPGFAGLYIGDSPEDEAGAFIEQFRKLKDRWGPWYGWRVKQDLPRESVLQAVEAAKQDMDRAVRSAAGELESKLRGNE